MKTEKHNWKPSFSAVAFNIRQCKIYFRQETCNTNKNTLSLIAEWTNEQLFVDRHIWSVDCIGIANLNQMQHRKKNA